MRNSEWPWLGAAAVPPEGRELAATEHDGQEQCGGAQSDALNGEASAGAAPFEPVDRRRRVSAAAVAAPLGSDGGFTGSTLAKRTAAQGSWSPCLAPRYCYSSRS